MLERETDIIFGAVREHTLGRKTSISMKEILASDIPYPIKMFFRTDVESAVLHELQQIRSGSKFNYEHPEVQSLQRQMSSILILHHTMGAAEFEQRLDDVVHLVANFLIRPQWTMCGVLFEKDNAMTSKALLAMLKYFGAYEYLRDISSRYIRDKNVSSFTRKEFSTLLWKADGAYIKRKTGDELARILTPLYDFFDFPSRSNTKRLSVAALMKFFEDKGLSSVTARLEGELQHNTAEFGQPELADLLENVRRTNGAFLVDAPEPEVESEMAPPVDNADAPSGTAVLSGDAVPTGTAVSSGIAASSGIAVPSLGGDSSGTVITRSTTVSRGTAVPLGVAVSSAAAIPPAAAVPAETGKPANGEPAAVAAKASPLVNFSQSIGEDERKRFLKKLFKQDEPSFRTALEFMGGIMTWREASRFIDEIFIQNDIDPYSSDAKKFIDIIYKKFYPS